MNGILREINLERVVYLIPEEKINEVVERIVSNVNPEKVILFGSYAKGDFDDNSDLDILVVKDMDIPRYKRSRKIRKYLRGVKVPIDLLVYSQKEIDEWKDNEHAFISKALEVRYPDNWYEPTRDEVVEAYNIALEFKKYVLERIVI